MSTVAQFECTSTRVWDIKDSYSYYGDFEANSGSDGALSSGLPSPLNSSNGVYSPHASYDWVYNSNQGLCVFLISPKDDNGRSVDTLYPSVRSIKGAIHRICPSSHTRYKPALHLTPATVRSMVVACMIPLAATLHQYAMRLEIHQIYFVGAGLVLLVLLSLVIADGDGCDLVGYSPMNRDIFDARSPIPEVAPFGSMSPLIRNEYDARSPLFSH